MKQILSLVLSENNGTPRIDWQTSSNEPLSVQNVDMLITTLAGLREQMQPPVRMEDPVGEQVKGVLDPRWWVGPDAMSNGPALMFRHPGLGWLAFSMPMPSLTHLKDVLETVIDSAGQQQPPTPPTLN
ncbi:hypothetical protein [Burkholderia cenocepacia]|uniref:hypothetical protein n=1 Tax=Burkholderia cenocepacia TaxID=95486 RepID=UPI00076223A9|nr:hypothetical protein [Burkholderia cenocepacia]KWU26297.1 hypothetical protein AS149_25230 [Burkholderia cenocepacia]